MRHHLATVAYGVIAAAFFALSWTWAQGVVIAVGALCASLIAIVSAVRLFSSLRPVRFIWHQLVGEPLDNALERRIHQALNAWWHSEDGPGHRVAKLEAVADRLVPADE